MMQKVMAWLGTLMCLCLLLQVILPDQKINDIYSIKGRYDPSLNRLNNVPAFIEEVGRLNINAQDTVLLLESIDSLLSKRFYHGTQRYAFTDKWLIALLGNVLWSDIKVVVRPDELLKGRVTLCNQQQIVFQEILHELKFTYRTVHFNKHMASEVHYHGNWHLFDSDYEVELTDRPSAKSLISDHGRFEQLYAQTEGRKFNDNFDDLIHTKKVSYGAVGAILAHKMRVFHTFLDILGTYGGFVLLSLYFILKKRRS